MRKRDKMIPQKCAKTCSVKKGNIISIRIKTNSPISSKPVLFFKRNGVIFAR